MESSPTAARRQAGPVATARADTLRPLGDDDPRRARHQAHIALRGLDEDDPEPVSGQSMRSRRRTRKVEHDKGRLERTATGRQKVWKDRFWKRRANARADRRRAEQRLREAL